MMTNARKSLPKFDFHDPGASCARAWSYNLNTENVLYLQQFSSLLPGIGQTNQICSNDDQERVNQNCKFRDPRSRGSCARAWPYKSYSENALFL